MQIFYSDVEHIPGKSWIRLIWHDFPIEYVKLYFASFCFLIFKGLNSLVGSRIKSTETHTPHPHPDRNTLLLERIVSEWRKVKYSFQVHSQISVIFGVTRCSNVQVNGIFSIPFRAKICVIALGSDNIKPNDQTRNDATYMYWHHGRNACVKKTMSSTFWILYIWYMECHYKHKSNVGCCSRQH